MRIAILDTGFDLRHPDFVERTVVGKSFIAGQEVQDGHGHGTHCIGTAAGPKCPASGPRYGVASEAEIYAGRSSATPARGATRRSSPGSTGRSRTTARSSRCRSAPSPARGSATRRSSRRWPSAPRAPAA
ncbi:MAG: S8 family serine peptidase [Gaiellaceae bacterium]